jgi:hypothetical protein
MRRVSSTVSFGFMVGLSVAAVILSAVLTLKGMPTFAASAEAAMAATAACPDAGVATDASPEAAPPDAGSSSIPVAEALPPGDLPAGDLHLADGTLVAPLDKGAPRHVRFGVVLVTYEGAEGAPDKGARHKADALSLATKLAGDARADFRSAVERGDTGSSLDVGEVTRGVLEPAPEAVLFALPVGGVSGVIDTPRGFWIVKRLGDARVGEP